MGDIWSKEIEFFIYFYRILVIAIYFLDESIITNRKHDFKLLQAASAFSLECHYRYFRKSISNILYLNY